MAIHVTYELLMSDLPADCIYECSEPGRDAEQWVEFWVEELGFSVSRQNAMTHLLGYGAWSAAELMYMSDHEFAKKVLWLACNDFREGEDDYYLER